MATNNAIDLNAQGVTYYNGTGTFSGIDGSTAAKVLLSNGTGVAPSFQTVSGGGSYGGFLDSGLTGTTLADSTTYHFRQGQTMISNISSATLMCRYYITKTVTINKVYGVVRVDGTTGAAQNTTIFIRKNDTTNTNITTTLTFAAAENTFSNTSLGISLVAGDFIVFGMTTPALSPNPTLCNISLRFSE